MESQAGNVYRDEQSNRGNRGGQDGWGGRGGQNGWGSRGGQDGWGGRGGQDGWGGRGGQDGWGGRGGHYANNGNRGAYSADSGNSGRHNVNRGNREGYSGDRGGHNVNSGNGWGYNENIGNRGGHCGNRGGHNGNRGGQNLNNGIREGYFVNNGNRGGYANFVNSGNRAGHTVHHGIRGIHNARGQRGGYGPGYIGDGIMPIPGNPYYPMPMDSGPFQGRGYAENMESQAGNVYRDEQSNRGNRGGQDGWGGRGGQNGWGSRGGQDGWGGRGGQDGWGGRGGQDGWGGRGGHYANNGNRGAYSADSGNSGRHNVNRGNREGYSGDRGGHNVNSGNGWGYNENIGNRGGHCGNRGGHNGNRGGQNLNNGIREGYFVNNGNRGGYANFVNSGNRAGHTVHHGIRGIHNARGQRGGYGPGYIGDGIMPIPGNPYYPMPMGPVHPRMPPSNLHHYNPSYGFMPGSQFRQQHPHNFNQDKRNIMTPNNRGRNMSRSVSTPSVNTAGARPKEISHGNKVDNNQSQGPQHHQNKSRNDEGKSTRTKPIAPQHSEFPGGQHNANNVQELQVEDLDKMTPKPVIDCRDDSYTEAMPRKSKEDNGEHIEQNKGKIVDLMSELDDLCRIVRKTDNAKDKEQDNVTIQKQKDKPNSKDSAMSQQCAHLSKPPGSSLIFAFKEESNSKAKINDDSFVCEENKQAKSKQVVSHHRHSSMSESQADPNDGPQINAVFRCLVKQLGAESTPGEVVRKSDIFPSGCDVSKWFRRNQKRFNLVERNGEIVNVMAFNKEVTYCLNYITKRSCDKPDCERYHVCKDLLCGNCAFGEQCKFSHDFLDESNKNLSISKLFGYNSVFTNSEICSIVSVRYPRICVSWNENGSCKKANCTGLHICQRFILGDCFDDEAVCTFSHDKFSEHNKPILDAYRMGQWNDGLFKRTIFIMRSPRQRTVSPEDALSMDKGTERVYPDLFEEGATAMEVKYSPPEHVVLEEKEEVPLFDDTVLPVQKIHRTRSRDQTRLDIKPETAKRRKRKIDGHLSDDSNSDRYICDVNITSDGCTDTKCNDVHLIERIPYIWQLKIFGNWVTFPQSELIEERFCYKNSEAHTEIERDASLYVVQVKFDGHLHAFVSLAGDEGQDIVSVRRLSTRSYMLGNYRSQTYKTHWRWYFKDDMQELILFEPNMQYTLEQKFLANQKEYLYSRDNYRFKYMFSFSSMKQTNLDTGKSRDAIRRPIFISREDIEMGSYPESMKVPPKIQTDLPQGWAPWDLCNRFEFVKLLSESGAYRDVEASFFKTLDRHKFIIDDIFRVQNPDLWSAYCTEEKVMQDNLERSCEEGAVVEKRLLFHGTDSLDAVRGIAINNFDPRISGKNATVYGIGAYFARDSKYSNCYTSIANKDRYMFRATVLIGEYTQSKKEYTRPPQKRNKDHELYDSCVDNVDNPEIFIMFDRPKYYPEYLVTYHEDKPYRPADDQANSDISISPTKKDTGCSIQ